METTSWGFLGLGVSGLWFGFGAWASGILVVVPFCAGGP